MSDFRQFAELAAARVGGKALAANDEFFAPKENLLAPGRGVFVQGKFTDRGKWMDGWETRRRRTPGHDWCVIRLGFKGVVRGAVVDTNHFIGNHPESCSLEILDADGATLKKLLSDKARWTGLIPRSPLQGGSENLLPARSPGPATHVRLNIYPDGGVARLRVHGEVIPDRAKLARSKRPVDLAALENGGLVLSASDMHFGPKDNLILPGRARNMGEGWETKRRRGPGHDWCLLRLGTAGLIDVIEVDTSHFKGNYPESCSLEGCCAPGAPAAILELGEIPWKELLARTELGPNRRRRFRCALPEELMTHARLRIYPDGGVARLRLFGRPVLALERLNRLPAAEAEAELLRCCGSSGWARAMASRRPFKDKEELFGAAESLWPGLAREEWLEAFSRHPKIGDKEALARRFAATRQWAAGEQAGADGAPEELLQKLLESNREYEERFGHIFIVCATGKSAEEMLGLLRERLKNAPEEELRVAAGEQTKITRIRLEKLLTL